MDEIGDFGGKLDLASQLGNFTAERRVSLSLIIYSPDLQSLFLVQLSKEYPYYSAFTYVNYYPYHSRRS